MNIAFASRTLTLLLGIFLILLAKGLFNKKKIAWYLSTMGISISLFTHILKGLDYEEVLVLIIPLVFLIVYRKEFTVKFGRSTLLFRFKRSILILTLLFIYAFFGFFALQGQFNNSVTLDSVRKDYSYSIFGVGKDTLKPLTKMSRWFEDSISIVGFVAVISAIASLFSPLIEKDDPTENEKRIARKLVLESGKNASDYLTLMDDKKYYWSEDHKTFIAYKIRNGVAVTLGDPIGEEEEIGKCVDDFINLMNMNGLGFVFSAIGEERKRLYQKKKLKIIKIGEEAVIKTKDFDLTNSDMKDVRNAVNKIKRENVVFTWFNLKDIPWNVVLDVEKIHKTWIESRRGPTLTFAVDYFPLPPEENAYLAVSYLPDGTMTSAFSFYPYNGGLAMGLELMLRSADAPNGIAESTIVEAVSFFNNLGVKEISLGMAPLSNIEMVEKSTVSDKAAKLIFDRFNQFYGYKSLFMFKKKFNSVWEHKYIAIKSFQELPKIILALVEAQLKEKDIIKPLLKKVVGM